MYRKLWLMLLTALLLPTVARAQSATSGKLAGRVVDAGTGETLPGASVIIVGTSIGGAANLDGDYFVLNIPVGTYTVRASYVGYQSNDVQNIRVQAGLTTTLNFRLNAAGAQLGDVVVVAQRPLVQTNATNTTIIKTAEDIANIPVRGVENLASLSAGVVQGEGDATLNIRGGRGGETAYYVDGVLQNNPLNQADNTSSVSTNAIEELAVQTGGFSAEYGQALSGVINVVTKTGSERLSLNSELITDEFSGGWTGAESYGYNLYNLSASGPIPGVRGLTFFALGERSWALDVSPSAALDAVKPNNSGGTYRYTGKLGGRFGLLDSRFSINGYRAKSRIYLHSYSRPGISYETVRVTAPTGPADPATEPFYSGAAYLGLRDSIVGLNRALANNSDHNPRTITNSDSYAWRNTISIGKSTLINVTPLWQWNSYERGDGVYFDNLLAYGDTALGNPGLYGAAGRPQQARTVAPDISQLYAMPNTVNNTYQKYRTDQYGFNADVTSQLGKHLVKVGGDFSQYRVRFFSIAPRGLAIGVRDNPLTTATNEQRSIRERYTGANIYGYGFDGSDYNEDFNDSTRLEGPRKPRTYSAFAQDKIELGDLVLNLGLRFDSFDPNGQELVDPFSPFSAGTDTLQLDAGDFKDAKVTNSLSPRLSVAFPVTDRTVFFANYGRFLQKPDLQSLLTSRENFRYIASNEIGAAATVANPNLRPERTTSYEIGARQQLGNVAALSVTGYFKETRDLIQTLALNAEPQQYITLQNTDFGTVKGLDFVLDLRRTHYLTASVNYSLSMAEGTGSASNSAFNIAWVGGDNPRFTTPLDFDQRHTGSVLLDLRTGRQEGMMFNGMRPFERTGLNLLFTFNSGRPYSQRVIVNPFVGGQPGGAPLVSRVNGAYGPWAFRLDARLDRSFKLGPVDLNAYVWVQNLLNNDNVTGVYNGTGEGDNSGFFNTPGGQSAIESAAFTVNQNTQGKVSQEEAAQLYTQAFQYRERTPANYGIPRQVRFGLRINY